MNRIAEEILKIHESNEVLKHQVEEDLLMDPQNHGILGADDPGEEGYWIGMPRRSGRYPWGSGDDPYQRTGDFISRVKELRRQKVGEKDIAEAMGCKSTSELRVQYSIAVNSRRAYGIAKAKSMLADGKSQAEVARAMNWNESTLRSMLNKESEARMNKAQKVADFLREQVDTKGMIDVGIGVERTLGISREKMNQALAVLEADGYNTYGGGVPQVTNPGRQTNIKVLCPPHIVPAEGKKSPKEIYDFENVHSIIDYRIRQDEDGNDIVRKAFVYPKSIDSSRVAIRYNEEGGAKKDGVIEVRRGVEDLSLGESHYAQTRILVDGNRYLKGMALHSDDIPDGVDIVFNTNKKIGTPKDKVMKEIKPDLNNPFGALIKEEGGQSYYQDKNGKWQLSAINKTQAEGDWGDWSDSLPSQFLSKQNITLTRKQLALAIADKRAEYEEICSLTNPTVKKELLESFAADCDRASIHLQAAALPRQKYQVILPIDSLKDTEVYAPNFEDGETVALVRYPHGGTFEIPILTVNNKHAEAKRILGNTPADAIGINSNVASRLSGADFDGDTVMVIPCNSSRSKVKITSTPALKGLEGFDSKMAYGPDEVKEDASGVKHYFRNGAEYKTMGKTLTQTEMGKISNLITDMTLRGAVDHELARAVRHSMVVIDAEKHKLDYKKSFEDNQIAALKHKYQGRIDEDGEYHEGASTLISRAKSETQVLKRKGSPRIDPETGEVTYKEVYETYVDKKGKSQVRTEAVPLMSTLRDARTISSGTLQEEAYADYANNLKALSNDARKEILVTGKIKYNAAAKATYQKEVDSLTSQLNIALMNAPKERLAQLAANSEVRAKKAYNPDMSSKEIKKAGQQALTAARIRFGAERVPIKITDREWDAIQSGAISENLLSSIIRNTDIDDLRQRAMPRATTTLSSGKVARIKAMQNSSYTTSEIAIALGISPTTVTKYLNGKE